VSDRAIWWPARRILMVADTHFGKAASFRALGQPVPSGTTHANLARLDALLTHWDAERLIVLGDFLHGPHSHSVPLLTALHEWRARHAHRQCVLIRGNHDDRAGDPPPSLAIDIVDEPLIVGPFALCHYPKPRAGHYVLAGHVHPAFLLRGRGRDRLRLPCFSFDPEVGTLPAFGEFTGHHEVTGAPGRRIVVVAPSAVFEVPARAAGMR
jgi:DNA ligase-associated metallophosphoesterase